MAPKKRPDEDSDDVSDDDTDSSTEDSTDESSTTETDSSESEDFKPETGNAIKNKPHDEEFQVAPSRGAAPAPVAANRAPAGNAPSGSTVHNKPHDEEFTVSNSGVQGRPTGAQQQQRPAGASAAAAPSKSGNIIHNDKHDEFVEVEDDMSDEDVPTPVKKPTAASNNASGAAARPSAAGASGQIRNEHHDEEVIIAPSKNPQQKPLPVQHAQPQQQQQQQARTSQNAAVSGSSKMAPPSDDDDSDTATEDSDEEIARPTMTNVGPLATSTVTAAQSVEYNPADYAHITNSVPPDVRDLFAYITAYQPVTIDCPTKLRPFIPDYIPSVGDIDTFCKVPRPDDKADNFGLTVVDEPSSTMSNPAIVFAMLVQQENVSSVFVDKVLDSLEDAANRPQMIDRWINDLRQTHNSKAAPTVYYTKPMPSIESLMQEWPRGFEDILNSDLQLPPPGIDLDIEQYVRMLCAILDIPVHNNLVESLHVMFTLYLEFRENQHFKAA